ncbi:MAG: diaminopimelate epimerase, partial [Gammaproteobacteria bacterium]|nr:diaminopimelate epimerase [Gammaproteobacteria bacterium]
PSSAEGIDFRYRIYNADGGEVGQCGNGARCFAQFVREKGLSDKDIITVETLGGILQLAHEPDGMIKVDMGVPRLNPGEIPFLPGKENVKQRANRYTLQLENNDVVENNAVEIGVVSMGNPHAVIQVDQVDTAPVKGLGPEIEQHSQFPEGVNVGFMQILSSSHIRLRVYERGSGETLACGSGACAAVVAGCVQQLLDSNVKVDLPGGRLVVSWTGNEDHVFLTGPATTVYEGTIEL